MSIEKRILAIVAVAVLSIVAVIASWTMIMPSVTATAILRVRRPAEMPIEEFNNYRNAQRRMMLSEYVLSEAAEDPLVARTRFISKQKNPAKSLADKLKDISEPGSSELIVLTFECPDGDEATTILNEIIDEYMSKIFVEARVQREGLLSGVKETHKLISRNYERLKLVREVLVEVDLTRPDHVIDQAIRLEECRRDLETKKTQLPDAARAEQLEQTIRYIDQRLTGETNQTEDLSVKSELEKLDRDLQRYEVRLRQIASDIAEWDSYPTPEITVIQHAEVAGDRN